jgi:hypothetical protein
MLADASTAMRRGAYEELHGSPDIDAVNQIITEMGEPALTEEERRDITGD